MIDRDDPYYVHPSTCPHCGERDVIVGEHECPPTEEDYGADREDECCGGGPDVCSNFGPHCQPARGT